MKKFCIRNWAWSKTVFKTKPKVYKIVKKVNKNLFKNKFLLISKYKRSMLILKIKYMFSKFKMTIIYIKCCTLLKLSLYKHLIVNIFYYTFFTIFRFFIWIVWAFYCILQALMIVYRLTIYNKYTIFWILYLRKIKIQIRYKLCWFKSKK